MLSPFPGMDPFLEDRVKWSSVHSRLINAISDQLADLVSPHFLVDIEQRVYLVSPENGLKARQVIPDIYLINNPSPKRYGAAAAQITMPVLIEPLTPLEIREHYLEIRDAESREVVTTIELLSPGNKTEGMEAHDAFYSKRKAIMNTTRVHWIEIDLLRGGERPIEVGKKSDYYALLKRGNTSGPYEVWLFNLRDTMPTIAVPLRPPLDHVPLNLQAAFNVMYRRAHYADGIDYTDAVPPPPLKPADAEWVEEQVQKWRAAGER